MNVVKVGDDGSFTMFRYATATKPPSCVNYKTLKKVQEECDWPDEEAPSE